MAVDLQYSTVVRVTPPYVKATGVIDDIMAMGQRYVLESGLKFTYDYDSAKTAVFNTVYNGMGDIFVLDGGDHYKGFSIMNYSRMFSTEYIASLVMFYICPEFRNYRTSRKLMDVVVSSVWPNTSVLLANSISLIDDRTTRAYGNLLRRCGLDDIGPTYMKEM